MVRHVVHTTLLILAALSIGLMTGCNTSDTGTDAAAASSVTPLPPAVAVTQLEGLSFSQIVHRFRTVSVPVSAGLLDTKYLLFNYSWNDDVHLVALPQFEAQGRLEPEEWIAKFQMYEWTFGCCTGIYDEMACSNWFQLGGRTDLLTFGSSSNAVASGVQPTAAAANAGPTPVVVAAMPDYAPRSDFSSPPSFSGSGSSASADNSAASRALDEMKRSAQQTASDTRKTLDDIKRQGEESARDAKDAADKAERRNRAVANAQKEVARAQADVASAQEDLSRHMSSPSGASVDSDRRRLDSAQSRLSRAQKELADVMRRGW